MLTTDAKPRERILLMGGWGTGKTQAWCEVAKMLRLTKSPAKMVVLDTDFAAERSLMGFPGYEDNVTVKSVETWDELTAATKQARKSATRDDFLVIDMYNKAWDFVQAAFTEKAFGVEIDQWFLDYRRDHLDKGGHALAGEYGINWGVINKMHQAWVSEWMRWPGHVIACTTADHIQAPNRDGKGGDTEETRAAFGKWGVKPGGQKLTGFLFHTILLLGEPQQGKWIFTTVRDRVRVQVKSTPMTNFVTDYLVNIGGWRLDG